MFIWSSGQKVWIDVSGEAGQGL